MRCIWRCISVNALGNLSSSLMQVCLDALVVLAASSLESNLSLLSPRHGITLVDVATNHRAVSGYTEGVAYGQRRALCLEDT